MDSHSFMVGESLVGDGNEVAHIDLIIGSKSGPAGAAFTQRLADQTAGHNGLLAVLAPNVAGQAGHGHVQQGHHQGRRAGGPDVRPGPGRRGQGGRGQRRRRDDPQGPAPTTYA